MISDKYKAIFIHIPRTGGHTVDAVLEYNIKYITRKERLPRHAAPESYQNKYSNKIDNYFKFTFVRNPYDRVVSAWSKVNLGVIKKLNNDLSKVNSLEVQNKLVSMFENFILNEWDNSFGLTNHFRPLKLWFRQGKKFYDFIGRFEHYERDINSICSKLNINMNQVIPHISQSIRKDYKIYYNNQKVIDKVKEMYKEDFELFDYKIGD